LAGDLMVAGVPRTRPAASAGECLEELRGVSPAQASVVAVFDGELLVGLLSVEHLATADPRTAVSELMVTPPASVDPETPIESAAAVMIAHDQTAVVVARPGEALLGIVPPERLARVVLAEHEEDMARIGGYRAGSRNAIRAAEEPLVARLWHRLPWLVVGLAGAMASVLIVGSFEEQLNEVVLLAFFVPAVVYMADSVGTQTETLLIRALAANVHVGRVIRKELLTGVLLGSVVAVLFYPFALIGWGNADVALAVALALFCSCSIATAVAMVLPVTLRRLGFDPAYGSGPLATVIQDLLSIAIYFAIGVPLAT
jgi:magnesium transporter